MSTVLEPLEDEPPLDELLLLEPHAATTNAVIAATQTTSAVRNLIFLLFLP
jgi:hypothetical protein